MKIIWNSLKRVFWVAIIGTMIAFHNTFHQEFKSLDDVQQEIVEDEEE